VTIVRLDTGEVLMRFRGVDNDDQGLVGLKAERIKNVGFDSPMTGTPVAYPSRSGQSTANYVFVGDADGTLWRIDLRSEDPDNWNAEIAWDSYAPMLPSHPTVDQRQPIDTPPVIALDRLGNEVVLFSTGDQDAFATDTDALTYVWSLSQTPSVTSNSFTTEAHWVHQFRMGERVTGPISVFDQVAYFASFTPNNPGENCSDGFGTIWGVHYASDEFHLGVEDLEQYAPVGRLCLTEVDGSCVFSESDQQDNGTVVFGVAIAQEPTCTTGGADAENNYIYGKSYQSFSHVTAGKFQLVYQTGRGETGQEGAATTRSMTIDLPSPTSVTFIDSWASVVE
jgi:type IV pilus assembly protein PilY1